jgi:hypothetical protein
MTPAKFPQQNIVFAKDQPEYNQLPAYRNENGEVLVCWKLTLRERLRVLLGGRIWHRMLTFNQPLQPQYLTTIKEEVLPRV